MSIAFVSLGVIDLCVLSGCILSVVRRALGNFACSVGNVSEEMLKRYIENQG